MRILSTSIIAVAMATPLFAGNDIVPAAEPVIVAPMAAPSMARDWTGAYVGGQIESGTGNLDYDDDLNPADDFSVDADTKTYGVFGGYRRDFGSIVVGGEIDVLTGELEFSAGGGSLFGDIDTMARAGVEVGYDAGNALIYGTAGFVSVNAGDTENGYFYGIGMDYMITDDISIGAELLYHEFDVDDDDGEVDFDLTTIGLNVAYNF